MKRFLSAALLILAMFFVVSCGDSEDESNQEGGSCSLEGAESCSGDGAQILICNDSTWVAKKICNLNFGQYCRQTASGSYSCTDSENGGNNDGGNSGGDNGGGNNGGDADTAPETNDNDTADSEPNDNEPADNNEPNDNDSEQSDNESANDNDSGDNDSAPDNDSDNEQLGALNPDLPAPGDCANITKCIDSCDLTESGDLVDADCPQNCINNGTIDGKAQRNDLFTCGDEKSCKNDEGYSYACLWEKCRNEYVVCGLAGDTLKYKVPYGKVTINGTFNYLHNGDENESVYSTHVIEGGFITGSFGNYESTLTNLIDEDATPFAYASLEDGNIMLYQNHNTDTTSPDITMLIDDKVLDPGTYTFGLADLNRIFVVDMTGGTLNCSHALGYGDVNITAISYELGDTTISLNGEVELYSMKAAPYFGGDVSNESLGNLWKACEPK